MVRLRGCVGWSALLLVAYRLSRDVYLMKDKLHGTYKYIHDLSAQFSADTGVHVVTISQLRTCVMKIEHIQVKLSDVTIYHRDFS